MTDGKWKGTVPDMTVLDILVPVLMVVGAIAVVALVYLVFTMLKDRGERRRDDQLMDELHSKRS